LIMDEPTSVLTPQEVEILFKTLRQLSSEGTAILYISHKLEEIRALCQGATILRRGKVVGSCDPREKSARELAEMMVGEVLTPPQRAPKPPGEPVLEVRDLSASSPNPFGTSLKKVSFTVRRGEILGIAGVAGNGQSELLEVLGGFGVGTGTIRMNGAALDLTGRNSDGQTARANGISHVPEDRQRLGLIMDFTAWENIAFGYQHDPKYQKNALLMDNRAILDDCAGKMERFDVRPPIPALAAKNFSGGNQQKIVLAREIERNPDLLLVGQPTRGVDIGAIEFIHQQIVALRDAGKAVLLVSVELDEIMSLADRIAVMFDGKIMGERLPAQTDERELGMLMAGMNSENAA